MTLFRALVFIVIIHAANFLYADPLDDFARDFWSWHAAEQPVSGDDVNRIERPAGWVPNWSPATVQHYRQQLEEFQAKWRTLDSSAWSVPRQVDYRLMGSAVARVRWELDLTRNWQRSPVFYVEQTLGAYFHLLLQPPPIGAERTRHIVATLASFPHSMQDGKGNLTQPA